MDHGLAGPALVGSYDYLLVGLSVIISILAAYAALDLARRVTSAQGLAQLMWLAGGATAMGFGIWSMHYVGMLAFRLPIPVQYDWPTVLVSLVAAILASAIALFVVSRRTMGLGRALLGSVLMGGGIATMHYVGMEAMRMQAICSYSPALLALSVVLAIVISLVALWLTFRFRQGATAWNWMKTVSAVVMGLAIPVMHYTGMAAATFVATDVPHGELTHAVSVSSLSVAGIVIVTFVVLGVVLLASLGFEKLPTARQLAQRYFVSLAAIGLLAIIGSLLIRRQGQLEAAATAAAVIGLEERKDQLHFALVLLILGGLLLQGLIVLRPALMGIQRGIRRLERTKHALYRKTTFVELLQLVASTANQSTSIEVVLQFTLERICERTGWPIGHVYMAASTPGDDLIPSELWYLQDAAAFDTFRKVTSGTPMPLGVGLPGRVARDLKPCWIADISLDENFPRREISRDLGLKSAFAFPVLAQGKVAAILEFFSRTAGEPDDELLTVMSNIGVQLGLFIERTRAQANLAQQAEALAHSNAELEQFAYVASHDLQEPLRMVASYTQLLARRYREKLDDEAMEFIDFAVDGATRMQTLIRDLLSYSRLTSKPRSPQIMDAESAARTACENLRKAVEDAGANIRIGSLPRVLADSTQLTQLFQNLIGNALKYRGADRPEVQIEAKPADGSWVFSVQDNGIGIDSQYFERIFQMFQRLHTRAEYPGTGIGLAICRKIVERHGGKIWVESQPGGGSTFLFTIPQT